MILQIDGWWAGGKGLLFSLLDGHSKVGTSVIHDASHMAFLSENRKEIFEKRDIKYVRSIIASKSEYYNFEMYYRQGYIPHFFSKDVFLKQRVPYNFYEFDKSWVDNLFKRDVWSEEIILETLYKGLNKSIGQLGDRSYFVCMSWPRLENQKLFFNKLPNAKNILVKRPVADIIASRSGRKGSFNTIPDHFAPGFEKIINSNEITDIIRYYEFWDRQQAIFPQQVYITNLSDLIYNRKFEMSKIASFLGIKVEETLFESTFLGEVIQHNGISYAEQVFDTAESVLSKQEIELVMKKVNDYKLNL